MAHNLDNKQFRSVAGIVKLRYWNMHCHLVSVFIINTVNRTKVNLSVIQVNYPLVTLTFLAITIGRSTIVIVIVWSILDGLTCILIFEAVILKPRRL